MDRFGRKIGQQERVIRRGGGRIKSLFGLITSRGGRREAISFANRQRRRLINNFDAKCTRTIDFSRLVGDEANISRPSTWDELTLSHYYYYRSSSGGDPVRPVSRRRETEGMRDSIADGSVIQKRSVAATTNGAKAESRDDGQFSAESTNSCVRERERDRTTRLLTKASFIFLFISLKMNL